MSDKIKAGILLRAVNCHGGIFDNTMYAVDVQRAYLNGYHLSDNDKKFIKQCLEVWWCWAKCLESDAVIANYLQLAREFDCEELKPRYEHKKVNFYVVNENVLCYSDKPLLIQDFPVSVQVLQKDPLRGACTTVVDGGSMMVYKPMQIRNAVRKDFAEFRIECRGYEQNTRDYNFPKK